MSAVVLDKPLSIFHSNEMNETLNVAREKYVAF